MTENAAPKRILLIESLAARHTALTHLLDALKGIDPDFHFTLCTPRQRGQAQQSQIGPVTVRRYDSALTVGVAHPERPWLASAQNAPSPNGLSGFLRDRLRRFPYDLIHVVERNGEGAIARRVLDRTGSAQPLLTDSIGPDRPWPYTLASHPPAPAERAPCLLFCQALEAAHNPLCPLSLLEALRKTDKRWRLHYLFDGPLRRQTAQASAQRGLSAYVRFSVRPDPLIAASPLGSNMMGIAADVPTAGSLQALACLQVLGRGGSVMLPSLPAWLKGQPAEGVRTPADFDTADYLEAAIQASTQRAPAGVADAVQARFGHAAWQAKLLDHYRRAIQ